MARPTQTDDEAILAALAAHPETTSADLAETLGIGQSTAAKRLAALETAGSVRRIPGGREAGRRAPDRWTSLSSVPGASVGPAAEAAEADTGDRDAAREDTAVESVEPATGPTVTTDSTVTADVPAPDSGQRLGRGELGSLVRDYLAARPDESFGPSSVGKALGRSQGAVSNSLSTMAAKGEVVLVGDKPRRYRIATGD